MQLSYLIILIIFAMIISTFLTITITNRALNMLEKANYGKISGGIFIFLAATVILFSGFKGLSIFIAATLLGVYTINNNVQRITLMSSLLIPTMLFYFGI